MTPFTALASALLHAPGGIIHVTLVHTEHNRRRLLRTHGPAALCSSPNNDDGRLRFETIPDGLPPSDSLDATQDIWRLAEATRRACPAHDRDLLRRLNAQESGGSRPPVSCVVADGAMGFVAHVAKEVRLPAYLFFTQSACGLLGYLHFGQLVQRSLVPFKGRAQTRRCDAAKCYITQLRLKLTCPGSRTRQARMMRRRSDRKEEGDAPGLLFE